MKKILAEIVSLLFHPVLFFLIMPFIVVYKKTEDGMYALKWEMFSIVFIFAVFAYFLWERKKGIISDFDISKREERKKFYIFLLFLTCLYLLVPLLYKGLVFPMTIIAFGIIFGIAIFATVNYFVKASVHMAIACAYVITITSFYGLYGFLFSFFIIPLIAWSRLLLKRHTVKEIIIGGFLGSMVTLCTFWFAVAVNV